MQGQSSDLFRLKTESRATVGNSGPRGPIALGFNNVILNADQTRAWVTNNNEAPVSVIDTATDKVIKTIAVGVGPRHTFFQPGRTGSPRNRRIRRHFIPHRHGRWVVADHRPVALATARPAGKGEKRSVNTIPPPGLSSKVTVPW
jgi:YVTN family beta-propeller protein